MSKAQELLEKFTSGGVSTYSHLNLRNEALQKVNKSLKIGFLKKETNKKARVLQLLEVATPFSPWTGLAEDRFDEKGKVINENAYNAGFKFRTLLSVEGTIKMIKQFLNSTDTEEAKNAKKVFMQRANMEEWDVSKPDEVNGVDKEVFKRYLVPRIFTLPVCNVNIPSFTGSKFGKDYIVKVKRDKITGAIEGQVPIVLQIHKLLNEMAFEGCNEIDAKCKSGELDYNEKDKKEAKKKIFQEMVLISEERPANFALVIELPLKSNFKLDDEKVSLGGLSNDDIFKMLKLVRVNREYDNNLVTFLSGDMDEVDLYNNFWEFDMKCSNDEDPRELGKNTRYVAAISKLQKQANFESFNEALNDYLENAEGLEKIFMSSAYVSKMTDELEDSLLETVAKVVPHTDVRYTDTVVNSNRGIITLLYGEDGDFKLAEADCGMLKPGSENLGEAENLTKEFSEVEGVNISNIISGNAEGFGLGGAQEVSLD